MGGMEPRRKKKLLQQGVTHHTQSPLYFNASCVLGYGDFLPLPHPAPQKSMQVKEHPQLKIRTGGNNFFTPREPRDVQQRALLHIFPRKRDSARTAFSPRRGGKKQTETQSTRVESLISYRDMREKKENQRDTNTLNR